jgi:cyclic dehypoxanthinyl futalosine synthase
MKIKDILNKSFHGEMITLEDALTLWKLASLSELMMAANNLRNIKANPEKVSWIIDRNINITNVCCSGCLFCNFYTSEKSGKAYITSIDEYKAKIKELQKIGGNQVLLQGGLHPKLGLDFYVELFSKLKELFPDLKLHALGPPEIVHLAKIEKRSYSDILQSLVKSGLDSLPGAGAEILSDRVRNYISKGKCSTSEWLEVMKEAHKLGITTSATMMYGHVETIEERMKHLLLIRDVQAEKPKNSVGFISFTPWPFQYKGTTLSKKMGTTPKFSADEYIRLISISRLVLNNIDNIQASWLTVGKEVAQICLHSGANDLSSIMIEENVVSAAGAEYSMGIAEMEKTIIDAGFIPARRDQNYSFVKS